ncbi:MAG: hypothetical protein ACRC92_20635 [Peptostreptococcaceae bacterium]
MNELEIKWNPSDNRWKQFKHQNKMILNHHLMHTFGTVFKNLEEYFKNVIPRISGISELKEVEMPQQDKAYQRSFDSNKAMLDRSYLPRLIMMYNTEVNQSSQFTIYNQEDVLRVNHAQSVELLNIKFSKDPSGYMDFLRDLDLVLGGTFRYTFSTMFITLLTKTELENMEAARQLKYHFRIDANKPIYKTTKYNKLTKELDYIPYRLEYRIPDDIIEYMKQLFEIPKDDNSDKKLLDILKSFSYNNIVLKVDGTEQKYAFFITMPTMIHLNCISIDDGVVDEKGNMKTYGVKMEFQVMYTDMISYKLTSSGRYFNSKHKANIINSTNDEKSSSHILPIYVQEKPIKINDTTEYMTYDLSYIDEDFKTYLIDEEGNLTSDKENGEEVKLATLNMTQLTDNGAINLYVDDILDTYYKTPEKITNFFNIRMYGTKMDKDDYDLIKQDYYPIDYDYIRKEVIDLHAKEGDSVYIVVYINFKDYNKWLQDNGYESEDNLSALK